MLPYLLLMMFSASTQDSYAQVEKLLANHQYNAALVELQKSASKSAKWHVLASKAYDGLNNPSQAVIEAEAALAIDPANESAHLQLGQIFLSRNTPDAAFGIYNDALKIRPNSFLLRLGKGISLTEMRRYDQAAVELRQCFDLRPSSGIVFDSLATALLHGMNYQAAMGLAEEFKMRKPEDFRSYYFIAAARDGLRLDDEGSKRILSESIRRNPNFAASHALLGKILLRQNAAQGAATALEKAVALRPNHLPSHMALTRAYRALGRTEEAEREAKIIRALNERGRAPQPALKYHRGSHGNR